MKIISRIFRPLPQVLYLEPVFGCNYRCFFCLHGGEHRVEPVQLTPAVFGRIKPIVDQAAHIHLTGLGEPFLNSHIGEFLAYFREKGKKYYVNTNGSLIRDAHIDLLLTSRSELSISLDAADKVTYSRMRYPDNWDKIIRIVKRISDLRFKRSSRFPLLYLAIHINLLNLSSLQYLPELCSDLRIDAVKLSWTILPEIYAVLSPYEELQKASQMIHWAASALRRKGIGIRDEVLFQPHRRECWNLSGMAFIGANGAMAACCNRWLAIGDLAANSFEEIWNGLPHRRIFFGVLNHRPIESCAECRQLQVVDYVASPGAFVKDAGADTAVLAQKRRALEKLPALENLEKQFAAGLEALTGKDTNGERALDIYAELFRRFPDYYEIRNNLAVAYFLKGQPEKSRELLSDIQSIPNNRGIVAYNLDYLKRQNSVL
jgi:wyosine [tRNA(Phe)-imidazoG37] synthetase (radical SAM superfamily)